MSKRLLTLEEIREFRRVAGRNADDLANSTEGHFTQGEIEGIYDDGDKAMLEAQRKETLKAVGELLKSKRAGRTMPGGKMALVKEIPDKNWVCFLTDEDIGGLENGEMSEEGK